MAGGVRRLTPTSVLVPLAGLTDVECKEYAPESCFVLGRKSAFSVGGLINGEAADELKERRRAIVGAVYETMVRRIG